MVFTYLSPQWFRGIDIFLELFFAIISLTISIYSYRIYKDTGQKNIRLFSLAFLFISVSYFIQTFINLYILSKLSEYNIPLTLSNITIYTIPYYEVLGFLSFMIFLTIGYAILTYITFKHKDQKSLFVILLISLAAIAYADVRIYMFYTITSIFLFFIEYHFLKNFLKNRRLESFLVALAFLFLLFGHSHFLITVNHQLFYAIGHILEFFAYILILTNLYLIQRK